MDLTDYRIFYVKIKKCAFYSKAQRADLKQNTYGLQHTYSQIQKSQNNPFILSDPLNKN